MVDSELISRVENILSRLSKEQGKELIDLGQGDTLIVWGSEAIDIGNECSVGNYVL